MATRTKQEEIPIMNDQFWKFELHMTSNQIKPSEIPCDGDETLRASFCKDICGVPLEDLFNWLKTTCEGAKCYKVKVVAGKLVIYGVSKATPKAEWITDETINNLHALISSNVFSIGKLENSIEIHHDEYKRKQKHLSSNPSIVIEGEKMHSESNENRVEAVTPDEVEYKHTKEGNRSKTTLRVKGGCAENLGRMIIEAQDSANQRQEGNTLLKSIADFFVNLYQVYVCAFIPGSLDIEILSPDKEKESVLLADLYTKELVKNLNEVIGDKFEEISLVRLLPLQVPDQSWREWIQTYVPPALGERWSIKRNRRTTVTEEEEYIIELHKSHIEKKGNIVQKSEGHVSDGKMCRNKFSPSDEQQKEEIPVPRSTETNTPSTSQTNDSPKQLEKNGKKRGRPSLDAEREKKEREDAKPDFKTVFGDYSKLSQEESENRYKLGESFWGVTFLVTHYRVSESKNSRDEVYEKLKNILLNEVKTTVYEVSAHAEKVKDMKCALFYQLVVELHLRDEVGCESAKNICDVVDRMSKVSYKHFSNNEQNCWLDAMMAITSKLDAITSKYKKDDRALDKARSLFTVAKVAKGFKRKSESQKALKDAKTTIENTFKGKKGKQIVYSEILLEEARAHASEYRYKESLDSYDEAARIFKDLSKHELLETCQNERQEVQKKIKK